MSLGRSKRLEYESKEKIELSSGDQRRGLLDTLAEY